MVLIHVMQPATNAVTTFENYPFNSMAKIGGKFYGVSAEGLFELDNGLFDKADVVAGAITGTISTGDLDFDERLQKRVEDYYISMRAEGVVTLTVYADEILVASYTLDPLTIADLKQRRSLIGKGARGRYWRFELSCSDDFDFDAHNILVVNMDRNI